MSDVIVGIDLGTTNSLVAVCDDGRPRVLRATDGSILVPSVIHWGAGDLQPIVGAGAKTRRLTDSAHTVSSVKRFMGLGKQDLDPALLTSVDTTASTDKNIVIKLGQRSLSAIELSAEVLKQLKKNAEAALGHNVVKAVITVPAYFNDSQRTATKVAGQLAGLEIVRIINEPTAAALAYGLDRKRNGHIVVYDLGGGTFDVSVLKLHDGIFEVLATNGDTALGGDDFDQALVELILKKTSLAADLNLAVRAKLIGIAEEAKFSLSQNQSTEVRFELGQKHYQCQLSRQDFNDSIERLVEKTISISARALIDSGLKKEQIDDVVMVGGSTRVLRVRERVREFFGKDLDLNVNPDEVVALGAAIQGDILSGRNDNTVLLDVVPLSLGIETYGGTIGKLIHRNTKIPAMAQETFTTHVDGQRNVLIHVLQGERELVGDCRSLARFELKGLPPLPAGAPKIQVTFLIDANGILKVKAKELNAQLETIVEVKPSYGLTDEQVEKMLGDSFDYAEQDMSARQLIETRVEAEGVLRSAEKILTDHSLTAAHLDDSEKTEMRERIKQVRGKMDGVRALLVGQDYIAIKNALEELEVLAKPVAEKVMNQAIGQSLSHKKVEDVLKNN